jgi:hypothetical protein
MKRSFRDIDLSLPAEALESRPEVKSFLDRIHGIEEQVEALLTKKKRIGLAMNAEPAVRQKILRLFVYSRFFKATAEERGYFMVHLDGVVLDADKSCQRANMAQFFDNVKAQVDKKFHNGSVYAEWDRDACPQGAACDGFAIKVYHDKSSTCKLFLERNADVRDRFELSAQLRSLIPITSIACTENEVLLSVWQCLSARPHLFDEKDKKVVHCDEQLCSIFNVDSFVVSNLQVGPPSPRTVCCCYCCYLLMLTFSLIVVVF